MPNQRFAALSGSSGGWTETAIAQIIGIAQPSATIASAIKPSMLKMDWGLNLEGLLDLPGFIFSFIRDASLRVNEIGDRENQQHDDENNADRAGSAEIEITK